MLRKCGHGQRKYISAEILNVKKCHYLLRRYPTSHSRVSGILEDVESSVHIDVDKNFGYSTLFSKAYSDTDRFVSVSLCH